MSTLRRNRLACVRDTRYVSAGSGLLYESSPLFVRGPWSRVDVTIRSTAAPSVSKRIKEPTGREVVVVVTVELWCRTEELYAEECRET